MGFRGVDAYIFVPGPSDFIHAEPRLQEVLYIDLEPTCVEECVCKAFPCSDTYFPTAATKVHQPSRRIHRPPAP